MIKCSPNDDTFTSNAVVEQVLALVLASTLQCVVMFSSKTILWNFNLKSQSVIFENTHSFLSKCGTRLKIHDIQSRFTYWAFFSVSEYPTQNGHLLRSGIVFYSVPSMTFSSVSWYLKWVTFLHYGQVVKMNDSEEQLPEPAVHNLWCVWGEFSILTVL